MRSVESRLSRLESSTPQRIPAQFIGRDYPSKPRGYVSTDGTVIYKDDDEAESDFYKRLEAHASKLPLWQLPIYWGVDENGVSSGW